MTNSARYFGVILTAALWVGPAVAQEPLLLDAGDSMTAKELPVPSITDESRSLVVPPATGDSIPPEMSEMTFQSLDAYDQFDFSDHELWDHDPAPIESTGTWLRRGFWYAEADAVVWNRLWNRDNKLFAANDQNVNSPFNQGVPLNTNRVLMLDGAQPGEDASVRVTLGHFLFRDERNRDHTAEFTAHGGGDWVQNRDITSLNPFGLFVPFAIDGANRSFDQSSGQSLDYSSHYSSFELNYRVKQRMSRDQLVMDPDGNWHRAAGAGFTYDYLVGLRMMEMRDILDWRAEDIGAPGSDGIYLIRTDNDLFGFQMGAGMTYESSRWSVGLSGKAGVYVNDARGRATLDFTDPGDDDFDFDRSMANDELSSILEARLLGKWHLTPNFSLRAACELMYVTSVALAPNQANFIPVFTTLNTTQDPFYFGTSFGFEGYW